MAYVIAYDLGTGGVKSSLHDERGYTLFTSFQPYPTTYPQDQFHEQRPKDWWDKVCISTRLLLAQSGVSVTDIKALAVSGHSLVCAPIDKGGVLLMDSVPIWSDTRAKQEAEEFFCHTNYDAWYETTGNGDPPECYSVMKLMWLKKHAPDIYQKAVCFLGSKDYVNFRFTGVMATDPSYASGSGVFDLKSWCYREEYIQAAGLDKKKFPPIFPSDAIVGTVTHEAALCSGLVEGTLVAAGGVDNACMALGACGIGEGRVYTSLGSSCWIAVTSKTPIIDHTLHPFVFAHLEKGYYTTGMSIFSGGTAHHWVREQIFQDVTENGYRALDGLAESVPMGANGVLFNPSLAGGSAQEKSPNIRGAFLGISLATTRADLIRATLEGISMNLRMLLDAFSSVLKLENTMLLVGGGAKSRVWRRIFADVYNKKIVKKSVDQDAASLGAAALAEKCAGFWQDFTPLNTLHVTRNIEKPVEAHVQFYARLLPLFKESACFLADLGDKMKSLKQTGPD